MKKLLIIGVSLVLVTLVTAGCCQQTEEKAVETAIEQATGGDVDVDLDDNSVKMNTNEGSWEFGEDISLPTGFPSDVYVADGTIIGATTITEGEIYTVSIETSKSVSALQSEYESELVNDGWEITSTSSFEGTVFLGADKGDRNVSVTISEDEDDGKTLVVLGTLTYE